MLAPQARVPVASIFRVGVKVLVGRHFAGVIVKVRMHLFMALLPQDLNAQNDASQVRGHDCAPKLCADVYGSASH